MGKRTGHGSAPGALRIVVGRDGNAVIGAATFRAQQLEFKRSFGADRRAPERRVIDVIRLQLDVGR